MREIFPGPSFELAYQRLHGFPARLLVGRLVRLEPVAIVVPFEAFEKGDGLAWESGECPRHGIRVYRKLGDSGLGIRDSAEANPESRAWNALCPHNPDVSGEEP